MVHHLVIGIIFLFWGVTDVLRLELPGVLARRLEASSEEARRLLTVMILAAVCILGPYYHWRKQEKENTQE